MGSPVAIGRLAEEEFAEFRRAFAQVFGFTMSEESLRRRRAWTEVDRAVAARADGRIIGTSGAYSFQLSLPGGRRAGCAGVTVVSVRADHRRRGVLTRMMRQLFEDAHDRDEPFAALWASEAPIYGRFGFGPAAPTQQFSVERAHAALRSPAPIGEVELLDVAEAADRVSSIYTAASRTRPGMLALPDTWWGRLLDDDPGDRGGGGELRCAVFGDRGFVTHRLQSNWDQGGVPQGTVEIRDLVVADADAEAAGALWGFVLDTDLASKVTAERRPVDDPLPLLLRDENRVHRQVGWPLYLALVDLPRAMTARTYAGDGALRLRVHDPFTAANDGVWRLSVEGGEATCEATGPGEADLEMPAEVLGALFLGGQRATAYRSAGRLVEHTPGTAVQFDRMFATDVAPWHGVMF